MTEYNSGNYITEEHSTVQDGSAMEAVLFSEQIQKLNLEVRKYLL
jgi:hypothetical protein